MTKGIIQTIAGSYSKEKFEALINLRETALESFREWLKMREYKEVLTASLVNIAGSCENPQAAFSVNFYGRQAHLSQSAQLQLESLVIRLKQGFFTVNNSFREENFPDPEKKGRMLSEFTLIEPEKPFIGFTPEQAFEKLIKIEEQVIKFTIKKVLKENSQEIKLLGGNLEFLKKVAKSKFKVITYENALRLLNKKSGKKLKFGGDLGIKEEREILEYYNNIPVFITFFPAKIKFFNMKRTADGKKTFSVDLLMPKLGETVGGSLREEDGEKISKYLHESKFGIMLKNKGINPEAPFTNYFNIFKHEPQVLRGGFGIGFERFIAFLINSTDILETIAYRTLMPEQKT